MKKSNLVFWGILLIDVLTILFFVLKWQVPFKIFGWVSAAVLTIFVLGVVASIKDLKKDLGKAPGFMVAMIMFAGVRERLEGCDIPKALKGLPITLIAAALVSLSIQGFAGVVDGIFGLFS